MRKLPNRILPLLICLNFTVSYAQIHPNLVTGRITNTKGLPLGSANVTIGSTGMGTISNSSGTFTIRVPDLFNNDTATISLVGYTAQNIPIRRFLRSPDPLLVTLEESVVELQEVIVKPVDGLSLIQHAISKIPTNRFNIAGVTKGFYREMVKRDEQPIVLSEAIFDIFRYGGEEQKQPQLKLIQKRSILDEKGTAGLEFGMSASTVREFDIVSNLNADGIINTGDLKKYNFRYKGELHYNSTPAIAIAFDQKEGAKESLYKGLIYLDKVSMAFISFDIQRSPIGLKYAKYGNGKMRLLLKLMGISITMLGDTYRIQYRKVNEKWMFASAKTSTILRFKSDRRQYDFNCNIQGDYLNTEIDTIQSKPFRDDEVLSNRSIEFKSDEPEMLFWKEYNIIPADYDEKKVIERILANNNEAKLKERVRKLVSKLPKSSSLRIDSILSIYHREGNFNGSALIRADDELVLRKNYGFASKEGNIAFSDHSTFRIGSLSKSFTAVLIQQLHREGKLQLTDNIQKFIPTYKFGNITIEQLLTHTSGIPNFTSVDENVTGTMTRRMTPEQILFEFCSDTLDFIPGSKFRYSNSGYTALAAIIEKISGVSYQTALTNYIFIPLKMNESGFGLDTLNTRGYLYDRPEPYYPVANMAGAGGISSSINDLLKWDLALYDTSLLDDAFREELFIPRSEYRDWGAEYGYGWMIDRNLFNQSKKNPVVYHPGTDFGYYTMFVRQPAKRNLVILLNNTGDFERFDMMELILDEINR